MLQSSLSPLSLYHLQEINIVIAYNDGMNNNKYIVWEVKHHNVTVWEAKQHSVPVMHLDHVTMLLNSVYYLNFLTPASCKRSYVLIFKWIGCEYILTLLGPHVHLYSYSQSSYQNINFFIPCPPKSKIGSIVDTWLNTKV